VIEHTLLVHFLGILFTITCHHSNVKPIPRTDSLQFKTIVFSRSDRDCEKCNIEVKFSYPQITKAMNLEIRDTLNNNFALTTKEVIFYFILMKLPPMHGDLHDS
jgi:hypothetical protein